MGHSVRRPRSSALAPPVSPTSSSPRRHPGLQSPAGQQPPQPSSSFLPNAPPTRSPPLPKGDFHWRSRRIAAFFSPQARLSMDGTSSEQTVVPLGLLREITDGFSEERKIGSGTHGKVYLGVHPDGQKLAVKLIHDMPGVDDKQFQNEFKNLARLRHKNIVRLVGYCHDIEEVQVKHEGKLVLAQKTHRALCLEYMSNGSLQNYLSDKCDKYNWRTGYGIIKGICQGLKYLHNELKTPIYHLDLKPDNVLLDENMVPRIADFGISRLFGDELTRATISSLGTVGYLPPEYIRNNLISSKFDIFSLGVVIIKIMAGRSGYFNITDMSSEEFTNFVQEKWMNRLHETSDLTKASSEQVKICIEIGLSCVQEDRHKRPAIQDIVDRLNETETEATHAAKKNRLYQMQEQAATSLPSAVHEPPPRHVSEGFPETGSITGVVKLRFDVAGPKDTLFTRCPVWKNGANAKVAILQNEKPITQGDLSKLEIEILPVHADFFTGQEHFTKDEFSKQIYIYKGKELVLTTVSLTNGESSLGLFSFPESSHRRKLRLTARVKRQDLTVRVQEAITDPFVVKDRRSESNKKSSIPSKEDAIHQLKKICLKGKHWRNLVEKNITKVKHLLRHYHKDRFSLQELAGMKNGDWNAMIEHATMSLPGDEIYSYRVPGDNCEILFNDFYELVGKMTDDYVPYSVNDADQFPQHKVKNWKMSAYKKFEELENSGGLIPDYFLSNDRPVPAAPPNNSASTSQNQTTAEFAELQNSNNQSHGGYW